MACRQHDLRPIHGKVLQDVAATAACSMSATHAADTETAHVPVTPHAQASTHPSCSAQAKTSSPAAAAAAAHTPETADVGFRPAGSQPNEAGQVGPSVAAVEGDKKKRSTLGGAGTAAAQGSRQPARCRRKVQGDSIAVAICLGDSDDEGDVQVAPQQPGTMPTGMLDSGTGAAKKRPHNASEKM